jgi:hypothetical protein
MKFKAGDEIVYEVNKRRGRVVQLQYLITWDLSGFTSSVDVGTLDHCAELVPAAPKFKVGDLLRSLAGNIYRVDRCDTNRYMLINISNTSGAQAHIMSIVEETFTKIGVATP